MVLLLATAVLTALVTGGVIAGIRYFNRSPTAATADTTITTTTTTTATVQLDTEVLYDDVIDMLLANADTAAVTTTSIPTYSVLGNWLKFPADAGGRARDHFVVLASDHRQFGLGNPDSEKTPALFVTCGVDSTGRLSGNVALVVPWQIRNSDRWSVEALYGFAGDDDQPAERWISDHGEPESLIYTPENGKVIYRYMKTRPRGRFIIAIAEDPDSQFLLLEFDISGFDQVARATARCF